MGNRKLVREQRDGGIRKLVKDMQGKGIFIPESEDNTESTAYAMPSSAGFVLLYSDRHGLAPLVCSSLKGSYSNYKGCLTRLFSNGETDIGVFAKLFNVQFNQAGKSDGSILPFERFTYHDLLKSLDNKLAPSSISCQLLPIVKLVVPHNDYYGLRRVWSGAFNLDDYITWIDSGRDNKLVLKAQKKLLVPWLVASKYCYQAFDKEIEFVSKDLTGADIDKIKRAAAEYSLNTGLGPLVAKDIIEEYLDAPIKK